LGLLQLFTPQLETPYDILYTTLL